MSFNSSWWPGLLCPSLSGPPAFLLSTTVPVPLGGRYVEGLKGERKCRLSAWKKVQDKWPSTRRSRASAEKIIQIEGRSCLNRNPASDRCTSCCCCSVAQSCPSLCNPMNFSMPGPPVLHFPPNLAQTHTHWVGHPTISSSVTPFSCLTSLPTSGSFLRCDKW